MNYLTDFFLTVKADWTNYLIVFLSGLLIMYIQQRLVRRDTRQTQSEDRYFTLSQSALEASIENVINRTLNPANLATKDDIQNISDKVVDVDTKVDKLTFVLKNIPFIGNYLAKI